MSVSPTSMARVVACWDLRQGGFTVAAELMHEVSQTLKMIAQTYSEFIQYFAPIAAQTLRCCSYLQSVLNTPSQDEHNRSHAELSGIGWTRCVDLISKEFKKKVPGCSMTYDYTNSSPFLEEAIALKNELSLFSNQNQDQVNLCRLHYQQLLQTFNVCIGMSKTINDIEFSGSKTVTQSLR